MQSNAPAVARPIRMCIGCRRTFEQADMVRFGVAEHHIAVDVQGRMRGRGCYVCHDEKCIDRVLERGARRLRWALRSAAQNATVDAELLRQHWGRTTGHKRHRTHENAGGNGKNMVTQDG